MLTIAKAKLFLRDLLLAVASDKRGLHDVLTGRMDGLEPPFNNGRTLCAFKHYVGAMELGAVEREHEQAIVWVFCDPRHGPYILRSGERKPRGDGH